jgi:predicted N-acyltransferase
MDTSPALQLIVIGFDDWGTAVRHLPALNQRHAGTPGKNVLQANCSSVDSFMSSPYTIHIAQSMKEIDAEQWDACANPVQSVPNHKSEPVGSPCPQIEIPAAEADAETAASGAEIAKTEIERFNPFITHAFLNALETSKSVASPHGWTATHVLVKDHEGKLAAAAPAYLKTHSYGEYVFDHAWADAYHRGGLK